MVGQPQLIPSNNPNVTTLDIKFDSPVITTEQEVMAYSFGSLIADFGGLLGLFVGFNFLMIWDCILYGLKCLKSKKELISII